MTNIQLIKKIALVVFAAIILTVFIFFSDNTDYEKHDNNLKAFRQLEQNKYSDHFQEILRKYDNFCINGKDKSKLNAQQQHEEFLKGPCAPVILTPGLLGTILQLKIDCEKLQSKNPEIFQNCGWGTCSKYNVFKKRPASEYRLWIGGIFSKTSFLQLSSKDKCYGDLIGLAYNREKNILEGKEGLEVTWYGNTEQTRNDSQCGANSIKDFAEDIILKNALGCTSRGFGNIIELLDNMGYQSGLTYQAIPYDFRQDVAQSETQQIIPKAIDHLYELTGKKAIILGHSLGNLHILNSLSNIPQETKDLKIKQFIAAGPPFLGTPKSFIAMLGGNPEYVKHILGKQFGMNYYTQISFTQGCSSSYDILIKDTFDKFKNEDWMKEIIRRINYEETGYYENSIPFAFLPNPQETCLNDVFETRKGGICKNGLVNLQEEVIVRINGEAFKATMDDIQKIITKYSTYDIEQAIRLQNKSFEAEGLQNLINPNVPTSIVYSNMLKTDLFFSYNKDTQKVYNETNNFYFADHVESGLGDGTVPTFSAIVPGLKWYYEHQQEKENSKPLKLVELCSNVRQENPFYDSILANGESGQTHSEYRGINCECSNGDKQDICGHTCMINDSYFLDFLAQSLVTFQKSSKKPNQYSLEELENLISTCPTLKI